MEITFTLCKLHFKFKYFSIIWRFQSFNFKIFKKDNTKVENKLYNLEEH